MTDLGWVRRAALSASLPAPSSLEHVLDTMEFVQYDPIRHPARAQDLILHQRVFGYRRGDLERNYARLALEEDYFYAYGAVTPRLKGLLHPRLDPDGATYVPGNLAAGVLAFVTEYGPTGPRDLELQFGRDRAVNAWGGFSAASTRALEVLHYHGLLRVVGRRNGVKIYDADQLSAPSMSPEDRLRELALRLVRTLAPVPESSLRTTINQLRLAGQGLDRGRKAIGDLVARGQVEETEVSGIRCLSPAGFGQTVPAELPPQVRIVAPFDPVVWDRRRFELAWGWPYRFEAYTPKAKRRFGYYAMPMFWGDAAVGWVNCEGGITRPLDVEADFAGKPIRSRRFRSSFDVAISELEAMLGSGLAGVRIVMHDDV